mgnify:CR=1 FL=1
MRIDKQDYEVLGECIVTDQVPASLIAQYFNDDAFKKWYKKKYAWKEEFDQHGWSADVELDLGR